VKTFLLVALAGFALAGCASSDKQAERAADFSRSESLLTDAQRSAVVECDDPAQCDQAWRWTKTYIGQHSSMPVVRADATSIESDVPSRSGRPVYSATRIAKGGGATITLYAQCRGMYGPDRAMGSDYDDCARKIVDTQNGFAPYLDQHLSAH
jgi:hypothetical protein